MFSAREQKTNLCTTSASPAASRLADALTRRCSTSCRRALALALGAATIASTGCAARQKPKFDRLTDSTIAIDPAMRTRDWDPAFAKYPNGAVVAGPTLFPFEPKRNQAGYAYYGADFLTFFTNLVVLPYSLVVTPPWTAQTYFGARIPPTSTAMPLPPRSRVPEPPPARPATPPTAPATTSPTFVPVPVRPMQPLTWPATGTSAPTTRPATNATSSAR
jgi:hypothetical protein